MDLFLPGKEVIEYLSADTSTIRSVSTLEAKCVGEELLLMLLQLL